MFTDHGEIFTAAEISDALRRLHDRHLAPAGYAGGWTHAALSKVITEDILANRQPTGRVHAPERLHPLGLYQVIYEQLIEDVGPVEYKVWVRAQSS